MNFSSFFLKMNRIGLVCAVEWEVPSVIHLCPEQGKATKTTFGGTNFYVSVSGIGQINAAKSVILLYQEYKPDYILSLGICGSSNDNMDIGSLIVGNRVHYSGKNILLHSDQLEQVVRCLSVQLIKYQVGAFQTFDYLVTSRKSVSEGVSGIDMESYGLAVATQETGLPLVVVKSVSDIIPAKETIRAYEHTMDSIERNFLQAKRQLDNFFDQIISMP
jgi:nucleoside phosphorylase